MSPFLKYQSCYSPLWHCELWQDGDVGVWPRLGEAPQHHAVPVQLSEGELPLDVIRHLGSDLVQLLPGPGEDDGESIPGLAGENLLQVGKEALRILITLPAHQRVPVGGVPIVQGTFGCFCPGVELGRVILCFGSLGHSVGHSEGHVGIGGCGHDGAHGWRHFNQQFVSGVKGKWAP